jgi:plastocyanin domain-containing protein
MQATDWTVIAAGLGAIAWVNWYFFVAGRRAPAAVATAMTMAAGSAASAQPAEVTIVVDGGYSPSTVRVKAGQPVRLVFDRRDTGSCSEEVVFPDFGVRRFLPTGQKTPIDITPPEPGRYEFMCGMSMLRGALVAER